jgi:predicted metalloprotease with PDZ domain
MQAPRLIVIIAAIAALAHGQAPRLVYTVEVKDGDTSAFHHALEIERPRRDEVRLSVAAWAPGSYRLMNAFQNVQGVRAVDEGGAPRDVRRDGDLTWVVEARGAERLRVEWRFENPGKSVNNRTYLTATAGLLDGPRNYLYWRDHKHLPAHVRFKLPEGWKIATGLTATFDPTVFVAADADWLLDCPVLVGKIETWTFDVGGVPHRVALDNRARPVAFDADKFVECIRRITKQAIEIFGNIPYEHYTYLFSAGGGGGLEHLTSTTIGVSPQALATNPDAHMGVIAHEFVHAWNVKRLRPRALGPFDYDGPVRTKSLWICEGITNYYTNVLLSRAGFTSEQEFLDSYGRTITGFVLNPASRVVSPEEASWTVWDGPYLAGPIDYYTQGEILGLLMDLEIRGRTENRRNLDHAMRLLYERFSGKAGYQSEDVVSTIFDATGVDLHDFFLKHVSAAREIDWARYFRHMGCRARVARRPRTAIAVEVAQGGGDGVAVKVPEGSALGRLGLRSDDVVLALNGAPVKTGRELLDALRKLEVGQSLAIKARRGTSESSFEGKVEAATDVSEMIGRRGGARAVVRMLAEDSALARSGLLNGDLVKAVDGRAVGTRDEFRAACASVKEGDLVKITVERGGAEQVIEHRATASVSQSFELEPDPAATPLELEIRRSLILGRRPAVAETKPARKAG